MRRAHALASLFVLALPGPCTTFDDVAPLAEAVDAATDAPVTDADAGVTSPCDAGIRFEFENDASVACQDAVDRNCCVFEVECAGDVACVKWIDCVNACPTPRSGPWTRSASDCGTMWNWRRSRTT